MELTTKEKEYLEILKKEIAKEFEGKFPEINTVVQKVLEEIEKRNIKIPVAGEEKKKEGFAQWLRKAMAEGTGSAGGYLVPEEYVNKILDITKVKSLVLQFADVIPVGSSTAKIPNLASDVSFTWTNENSEISESDPSLGQITINIKGAKAITTIPNELLEDASIGPALDAWLTNLFGRAYAKEIDRVALVGNTGSGDPFNGIINTPGVPTKASSSTTGPDYNSLVDATFAISDDYALNPVWVAHRTFYSKVFQLSDSQNRPLLIPGAKELLAYPFYRNERMPSTFTADKPIAIFGDLSNVRIGMRRQLVIETSKHAKFTYDQTVIRAKFRLGLAIWSPNAFVIYKTAAS